ncbi:hypothetical protein J6R97_03215 [bacterium]|nr:hypothetical protein [bacterium]
MALHDYFTNFLNSNSGSMSFNYGFGDFFKPNFNVAQGVSLFNCSTPFLQPNFNATQGVGLFDSFTPFLQSNNNSFMLNWPSFSNPNTLDFFSQNSFGNYNYGCFNNYSFYTPNISNQTTLKKSSNITKKMGLKNFTGYAKLTKQEAEKKAREDKNLEKLRGGKNWSVSSGSFINDIPYAARGINRFLDSLAKELGVHLTITSALGTKSSPHVKNGGHYDEINPKLDIGNLTPSKAKELRTKLLNTGYFSRVEVEQHGKTAHLDVKIKDDALAKFA